MSIRFFNSSGRLQSIAQTQWGWLEKNDTTLPIQSPSDNLEFFGNLGASSSAITAAADFGKVPVRVGFSLVDASAGNGSTSVTVPSDATLGVAFWAHWDGNGGSSLSTLALNSDGFSILEQLAEGALSNGSGTGVAILETPDTGSQTLEWTWSAGGARSEGGWIAVVWFKDHKAGDPYSDTGVDQQVSSNNTEAVLSSAAFGERIVFSAMSYGAPAPAAGGSVFVNNQTVNIQQYDLAEDIAAGSYTASMTGEDFSAIAAIALKIQPLAAVDRTFTGTLAAAAASMAGNVSVLVDFNATLLSAAAAVAGNVSVLVELSGALSAAAADLDGELSPIGGFSGTLAAGQSTLAGDLSVLVDFSGNLSVDSSVLAGAFTVSGTDRTFAGDLLSGVSVLSSALSVIGGFSGGLVSGASAIAAVASIRVDFSGALQAASPALAGATTQLDVLTFSGGLYAQDARVGAEWRVVFGRSGVSFGPVLKGLPWRLRVNPRRR